MRPFVRNDTEKVDFDPDWLVLVVRDDCFSTVNTRIIQITNRSQFGFNSS
jgi:hypothetical protein